MYNTCHLYNDVAARARRLKYVFQFQHVQFCFQQSISSSFYDHPFFCFLFPSRRFTMTTYSAFFSSGLLAAPHMYSSRLYNNKHEASPSLLGMGDMLDDTSDIEVDRSTTPTPATVPSDSQSHHALPRLRRRRSSLTVGTSPINCIKSPTRAAGNALQLQRHLFASPSRSRSGSIDSVLGEELPQLNNIASKSTSLLSRMRSGSVGTTLK